MQQQHATPTTTTTTDQLRRWWSARCSNHCYLRKGTHFKLLSCPDLTQVAMIAASCTPPAPELVGGSGGGWSCMLLLHPAPTCADAGPDLCTLHPDLCTLCLRWLSPAATYGGGVSPSAIGTNTPLAHVVVSPIATCAGGVYPSTHWSRYRWFHPLLLALVVFILPPTGADTALALELLALCGGLNN